MSMIGKRAVWWRWNDATGEQDPISVIITDEFYEPGDPVPGYGLKDATTGKLHGGIDGRDITFERSAS